jgi:hypothetical protein
MLCALVNDSGKTVGVTGSLLVEDVGREAGSAEGGGEGDAGVTGNGEISRRIVFLIDSETVGRVGDGVWGFGWWSRLAKKDLKCWRKDQEIVDIHLLVDIVSWIFDVLIVVSLGICFLGILSSETVGFLLNN